VSLPWDALETALSRLPRLGYTYAVDVLEPISEHPSSFDRARSAQEQQVKWHHKRYRLAHAYEEDAQAVRESAPDRRTFLLKTSAGTIRPVRGYRGDGRPSSRRGLPVCDARMLVNLVAAAPGTSLLDPFAGIGGIVIEALASGCRVTSSDCDPALQAGITYLGAHHSVADARRLPWPGETFDAIATEPPYHEEAGPMVVEALHEMYRVLKTGGRLAILCVPGQAGDLRGEGISLGLTWYLDSPINRKGLDVVVLAGSKAR
jgi:SAM-dependent methyltransferase